MPGPGHDAKRVVEGALLPIGPAMRAGPPEHHLQGIRFLDDRAGALPLACLVDALVGFRIRSTPLSPGASRNGPVRWHGEVGDAGVRSDVVTLHLRRGTGAGSRRRLVGEPQAIHRLPARGDIGEEVGVHPLTEPSSPAVYDAERCGTARPSGGTSAAASHRGTRPRGSGTPNVNGSDWRATPNRLLDGQCTSSVRRQCPRAPKKAQTRQKYPKWRRHAGLHCITRISRITRYQPAGRAAGPRVGGKTTGYRRRVLPYHGGKPRGGRNMASTSRSLKGLVDVERGSSAANLRSDRSTAGARADLRPRLALRRHETRSRNRATISPSSMGEEVGHSVPLTRSGRIRVFLNSCRHRGMKVVAGTTRAHGRVPVPVHG